MGASVPPSIGLIILASATGVSVGALFLAGFLPAAILALTLSLAVYIRARRKGIVGAPRINWRGRTNAIKGAFFAGGLPIIIIGGLVSGFVTPTEVSAVAVVYVLIVELLVHRKLRISDLTRVAVDTAILTGMLLFIVATASGLVYVSTFAGIPQQVGEALAAWSGDIPMVFLFMTVLALIPLGMLTEGLPALLIFPPLFLPTAIDLGINPLHYSMLMFFAVYIGANIPPLGSGYYLGATVMRIQIKDGILPVLGYLGIVAAGVMLLALIPDSVTWVPRLFGFE
jgi:tripartite ATP-independent transporter DctM subunit